MTEVTVNLFCIKPDQDPDLKPCQHREPELALAQPVILCQPLPVNKQHKQIKDANYANLFDTSASST